MTEKKELFSDRRWHEPPVFTVIGKAKMTPEEKKICDEKNAKFDKDLAEVLKYQKYK